ncbi:MAG: ABC transporter ATP-binding protein [Defluviitaleaceae bacterium]|nr:ABC transporter ATP-binding protein [Defluviitaleaceae bacterium]
MVLQLSNVTKLYKNGRGAEDISFALLPGEVLGLLGPNGSGKTTTMKAIAGLIKVNSGEITICGIDAINQHEKAVRHTGCLIEAPALYEHTTVLTNLRLAARFYSHVDESCINEVLEMVEMYRYRKDKVRSLSLGMRQRVGLAMALLSSPELLILDEPANGLDIEGMLLVRDVIKAAAAGGSAVLVSSHLANEIQQCATHVAVMHGGKMLAIDNIHEVLQSFSSVEDFFIDAVKRGRQGGFAI